ncbi:pyridoxal phosphate-dependent transferase [Chaetomidium leptoderma]|uniref:Pyridoxal phosphate-dependent transferase n=1 Tax=Chaetomidium leptoderma TaxID=669021 RepID=A0AAN6VP69_9PEZI|nr:pyridoxal phosphate-dependent transferase [Chaetomidium leptoderma]
MLSRRCRQRNETIIPKLLNDHGALLHGDTAVVDLSTAENHLLGNNLVSTIPSSLDGLSDSQLGYSEGVGGSTAVRQRIADLANDYFSPRSEVEASHVVLGAGGCFALNALMEQICDPGDGVLIAAPYWPGLDLSLHVHNDAKGIPVQIPLDVFFNTDSIAYYEEALASAVVPVRAVLICNPHNPLAKNYPRETLQATLDFCARHKLHFISDEVYALSQHASSTAKFVSALSLDVEAAGAKGLVHVLYSLSKDFGFNGLRIGAFISQDNRDVCLSAALTTFCQTSSIAALVAEKAVLSKENIEYVTGTGSRMLADAYGTVSSFLRAHQVSFVPAECAMFVFARLCDDETPESEAEFRKRLKTHGLVLAAGTDYHLARQGWFRICYACPAEKLKEGLERLRRCIEEARTGR